MVIFHSYVSLPEGNSIQLPCVLILLRFAGPCLLIYILFLEAKKPGCGRFASQKARQQNDPWKTNSCLLVLSREWVGMGVAGMIINSYCGSFPKIPCVKRTSKLGMAKNQCWIDECPTSTSGNPTNFVIFTPNGNPHIIDPWWPMMVGISIVCQWIPWNPTKNPIHQFIEQSHELSWKQRKSLTSIEASWDFRMFLLHFTAILRTHVSFMMTFVDPETDGFSTEPTYATEASPLKGSTKLHGIW